MNERFNQTNSLINKPFVFLCFLVHGGFTEWSSWEMCSASCGGGQQLRTRTCTNPPPSGGGDDCTGDRIENKSCNNESCYGEMICSFVFNCPQDVDIEIVIQRNRANGLSI